MKRLLFETMKSKMAYFSDIDLATLDRSRLNERFQYKLSLFNHHHHHHQNQNQSLTPSTIHQHKSIKTKSNKSIDSIDNQRKFYAKNHLNGDNDQKHLVSISKRTNLNDKTNQMVTKTNSNHGIHCDDDNSVIKIDSIHLKQQPQLQQNQNHCVMINNKNQLNQLDKNTIKYLNHNNNNNINNTNKNINNNYESIIMSMEQDCIDQHRGIDAIEQNDDLCVPHRKRSGTWP